MNVHIKTYQTKPWGSFGNNSYRYIMSLTRLFIARVFNLFRLRPSNEVHFFNTIINFRYDMCDGKLFSALISLCEALNEDFLKNEISQYFCQLNRKNLKPDIEDKTITDFWSKILISAKSKMDDDFYQELEKSFELYQRDILNKQG